MLHHAAQLKRLSTVIKWTTDDAGVIGTLHDSIVRLVQEVGISGLVEIANSAKMSQRVWKTFGGTGSGQNEIAELAAQDGVSFPVPSDVLKYIKAFMTVC
jgi:hypothetical protein